MMLIVTSSPDCTKRYCASTTPMLSSFVPLYSPMHTIPFTAVPFTTIPFTTIPATIHALYTHLSVYLRGHGAHLRRKRAMASRLLSFTRLQSGARLRLFCLLITSAMVRLCVLRSARWSIVDNLIRQVGLFLSIYIYIAWIFGVSSSAARLAVNQDATVLRWSDEKSAETTSPDSLG